MHSPAVGDGGRSTVALKSAAASRTEAAEAIQVWPGIGVRYQLRIVRVVWVSRSSMNHDSHSRHTSSRREKSCTDAAISRTPQGVDGVPARTVSLDTESSRRWNAA